MDDCQVTRLRVEMLGPTIDAVKLALTEVLAEAKARYGGQWELEDPGVAPLPTKGDRIWGRATIRRAK